MSRLFLLAILPWALFADLFRRLLAGPLTVAWNQLLAYLIAVQLLLLILWMVLALRRQVTP